MSKTLHPYYLQQMGIESWTVRKPHVQNIKLWVIGEALDINKQARSLFNKMLGSIGLLPEDICLKSTFTDSLIQELYINPPQLLLAIGNVAIKFLLNDAQQPNSLRGKIHTYQNTPLVVSYHPIDLLQHPIDKKQAYQDLLFIQQILAQSQC